MAAIVYMSGIWNVMHDLTALICYSFLCLNCFRAYILIVITCNLQEWAHKQYVAKHQQWASHQWGNFYYYRMHNIRYVA
jgi:hypothetical protein